jgi:hypothetical protein
MSFSDMMSSGRGPGVIGMLIALIVLAGFGLLFMVASEPGADQSIESIVRGQGKEIENLRGGISSDDAILKLAPSRTAEAKELAKTGLEIQSQATRIQTLKESISTGKVAVTDKIAEFEAYKDQYRAHVRGKAKGQVIDQIETLTGVIYKNVNIREVTSIGIQIRHEDGQKRIPFEELPLAMQEYYQYDASQKEKAVASENAARVEHEAAVAVTNDLIDQELAKQKAAEVVAAKERNKRDILTKQAQIKGLNDDIRDITQQMNQAISNAAAAKASGKVHFNKSNTFASDIQAKRNRIAALQSEILQMQSR